MDDLRIAWLNDRLPRKRVIGQGLVRNVDGRVLLAAVRDCRGPLVTPEQVRARAAAATVRLLEAVATTVTETPLYLEDGRN